MAKNEHIQSVASEFNGDEQKLINKIAEDWSPNFQANHEFKEKLDAKLQEKIQLKKQQIEEQAALDAVPRSLKWRFYLTWYGYAVVSFLVLFLIWFCTNIFTGTLKVPTKYTYLEQNEAFWNLDRWWELAYYQNENTARNFSYNSIDTNDLQEEESEYDEVAVEESTNYIVNTNNFLQKTANIEWIATMTSAADAWAGENFSAYWDYLLWDSFVYNQTYRFAYKNKLFPKLNSEYPVYKASWILMWSNTPNQALKNLKIWNVSFKNFQDLDIMNIEMEQSVENWYNISFDNRNMKLDFYPNSSRKASEFWGKFPSNKQILKNVEKDLKNLWISLKNYWDWIVQLEDLDENMWITQVFYPFIINWKTVRYPESNNQAWMRVSYDLNLQKVVSVIWTDIATYDVSNYPILDKKVIEFWIENWWEFFNQWALHENSTVVLFDTMEVVYIEKTIHEDKVYTIYVPAIKATVSTNIENYAGPSVVYQEII